MFPIGPKGKDKELTESNKILAVLLILILGKRVSRVGYNQFIFVIFENYNRVITEIGREILCGKEGTFFLVGLSRDKSCGNRKLCKVGFKVSRVNIKKRGYGIAIQTS